jgi:hypothetical protein
MENLFNKWKTKIPKYSEVHTDLFNSLSQKFGAEGERKVNLGKHFSTNYELYIFAFYLGLYNEEYIPIGDKERRLDFSHHIQYWGSKSTSVRKDFTIIQEYIFMSLVAKTDIDLIALDKGELSEEEAIKMLINALEAYANGGLTMIREKIEKNPNYFFQNTAFLNLILESRLSKFSISEAIEIESIDV